MLRCLTVLIFLLGFLQGCARKEPEEQLSAEARAIRQGIAELRTEMFASGIKTGRKAKNLALRIEDLSQKEKIQTARLFIDEVRALGVMEIEDPRKLVGWLYNYKEILRSVYLCADYLNDAESPFKLFAACADRFRNELADCRGRFERETDPELRRKLRYAYIDLWSVYQQLSDHVRGTYLPLVAKYQFSPERFLQCKAELEAKIIPEGTKLRPWEELKWEPVRNNGVGWGNARVYRKPVVSSEEGR